VTDAQNSSGEFIDRKMLATTVQNNINKPIQELLLIILDKVHRFVGDSPRFDDITMVILSRITL
jgi:serine phosphatase RsbU (regulator of sigma subunit)